MRIGWVAGSVRARLMAAEQTLGPVEAAALADCDSLGDAVIRLAGGPYGRGLRVELDATEAQRAVAEATLLRLRVLAGWLPRDGLEVLRALAAWFELANLEDRIVYLHGGPLARPFELGSLAVVWPAAARTQTMEELRGLLSSTRWLAPGSVGADDLHLGLRLSWARRLLRDVPEARAWTAGAVAILAARELFVSGRLLGRLDETVGPALGTAWPAAGTLADFGAALPSQAAWPLAGIESPDGLWQAEAAWWKRVEADAHTLVRSATPGRAAVVGAVALLAADARRVASVLGSVFRRGLVGVSEAVDAIS
jgi:hypothetical protein